MRWKEKNDCESRVHRLRENRVGHGMMRTHALNPAQGLSCRSLPSISSVVVTTSSRHRRECYIFKPYTRAHAFSRSFSISPFSLPLSVFLLLPFTSSYLFTLVFPLAFSFLSFYFYLISRPHVRACCGTRVIRIVSEFAPSRLLAKSADKHADPLVRHGDSVS